MSISIRDLATTDFSDMTTGDSLDPVTPGAILLHDFMEPVSLSANALATALHVPANRITGILNGTRGITADTALRLARYFGTTPQLWMNLQRNYDLQRAKAEVGAHSGGDCDAAGDLCVGSMFRGRIEELVDLSQYIT